MRLSLLLAVLLISFFARGQKQLLLMKGERVKFRFEPGDEIVFKTKGNERIWTTYVNNLFDTVLVTHRDTIPLHQIERIYFQQSSFANRIGGALVVGGAALFLIDQLNYTVIQGNDPSVDAWVSQVSLGAIAVGLPMMIIKKRYQRINYKHRLRVVDKTSFFYEHRR